MFYRFLQWVGGIALHWYYREIIVIHRDRIPAKGPMLVAVNHHNAMVDAIVAQWTVPRRLRITAKATLASTWFGALFVKAAGLIPLRRRSDEPSGEHDPTRNRQAFQTVIHALGSGEAILIFPEGKSHNEPVVAPLKMGLANMALWAREAGVRGIQIVPIGLTFADKARPNTLVVAQVGAVIPLDEWPLDDHDPAQLTDAVAARLLDVALTADVERIAAEERPVRPRSPLIALAAWWGRTTHKIPIELARRLALARTTNADEPAMYTMIYGLALTLVSYAIQLWIVGELTNGLVAVGYFVSLVVGAYWAAYGPHPQRRLPESAGTANS